MSTLASLCTVLLEAWRGLRFEEAGRDAERVRILEAENLPRKAQDEAAAEARGGFTDSAAFAERVRRDGF